MRMRIRHPEIFLTLDPGSWIRDGKNLDPRLTSRIRNTGIWKDLFRIRIQIQILGQQKNLNYKAEAWLSTIGCTL
jgi:hypothetical protein